MMTDRPTPDRLKTVIWDFNGTLIDDVEMVVRTVNEQLAKRGRSELTVARYRDVFGFPVESYYRRIGLDPGSGAIAELSEEFREVYVPNLARCRLRGGVEAVLGACGDAGLRQFVLSAMEETALRAAIDELRIGPYFEAVYGLAHWAGDSKAQRAHQLVVEFGIDTDTALWIGDTEHDAEVAEAESIAPVLVGGGHQSTARLRATGHPVFDDIHALGEWIGDALDR